MRSLLKFLNYLRNYRLKRTIRSINSYTFSERIYIIKLTDLRKCMTTTVKSVIARPNLSAFICVHLPTSAVKKRSIPLTIIKNIKDKIIKKCSDYPKPNSKSSKNAPANSNTATSNYSPPPPPQNTKKNSHGEATFTY